MGNGQGHTSRYSMIQVCTGIQRVPYGSIRPTFRTKSPQQYTIAGRNFGAEDEVEQLNEFGQIVANHCQ
jgi:hypothetical protein